MFCFLTFLPSHFSPRISPLTEEDAVEQCGDLLMFNTFTYHLFLSFASFLCLFTLP